ncbi:MULTISPECIES: hypothetical protein [Enterobacterales]|uniref:hypothetical protein n=1 Tax=Enterobacterales TaxID=91347 RepID=UPI0039ED2323
MRNFASSEQMQGIQEINHAVIHLNRMVQQNAEFRRSGGRVAESGGRPCYYCGPFPHLICPWRRFG